MNNQVAVLAVLAVFAVFMLPVLSVRQVRQVQQYLYLLYLVYYLCNSHNSCTALCQNLKVLGHLSLPAGDQDPQVDGILSYLPGNNAVAL